MPSILNATTTNGLVTSADNSGSLQLQTNNGTTAVTIDTSQNVGIGTTNPAGFSSLLAVRNDAGTCASFNSINTNGARVNFQNIGVDSFAIGMPATTGALAFYSSGTTERMRITSGGNQLTGTTTDPDTNKTGCLANRGVFSHAGYSGAYASNVFNFQWTGSARIWVDTTDLGTVQFSSDYRIKRNIETQTAPALERIMQLRPVTYQMADYGNLFKASDDVKEGFIAHEVQEVIPSGADGEKDAENQIQSLRVDSILSVAVKAIQELKAELDEVKAELDATKAEVQALKGVA